MSPPLTELGNKVFHHELAPGASHAVVDHQRTAVIKSIRSIVQSHFDHGAESVQISFVSSFRDAEQLEQNISAMTLEELLYIQSLVTGKRDVPRPASLQG